MIEMLKELMIDIDKKVYAYKYGLYTSMFGQPLRPFAHKLKELNGNKILTGVEIGVYKGDNSYSLLNNLNLKKLYMIDPFIGYSEYTDNVGSLDNVYEYVVDRFCNYPNVEIIRDYSENAIRKIPGNLDFCYIDGNHRYEYVKQDLALYWPKIKHGGMLAGHDIGNGSCSEHDGVVRAVSKFALKNRIQLYIDQPDWWFIKV